MVFAETAEALASVLNTTTEIAGFILGFVSIIVILIAFLIVFSVTDMELEGLALAVPTGIPFIFVIVVGWWPIWSGILMALIIALVVINPFDRR